LMAVAGGALFAVYGLMVRRNLHGFHPVTAFAAVSQLTGLISVALMLVLSRESAGGLDWGGGVWALSAGQMAMLMLSAVIGITLGHTTYFISIARLGVSTTSAVLQLQPVCVAAAEFAIAGELMTGWQWACGTIAVGGAFLLLYVQWVTGRAAAGPRIAGLGRTAGEESEGIETAEMDAMPVESGRERKIHHRGAEEQRGERR
jgi:drug/metabolite transporter (DMT)-like permease